MNELPPTTSKMSPERLGKFCCITYNVHQLTCIHGFNTSFKGNTPKNISIKSKSCGKVEQVLHMDTYVPTREAWRYENFDLTFVHNRYDGREKGLKEVNDRMSSSVFNIWTDAVPLSTCLSSSLWNRQQFGLEIEKLNLFTLHSVPSH